MTPQTTTKVLYGCLTAVTARKRGVQFCGGSGMPKYQVREAGHEVGTTPKALKFLCSPNHGVAVKF